MNPLSLITSFDHVASLFQKDKSQIMNVPDRIIGNPRESLMKDAAIEPSVAESFAGEYFLNSSKFLKIILTHVLGKNNRVSHRKQAMLCPLCHSLIITNVSYSTTSKTHLIAVLLCPILCCFLPYCLNWKNVHHVCPECEQYIGTYEF